MIVCLPPSALYFLWRLIHMSMTKSGRPYIGRAPKWFVFTNLFSWRLKWKPSYWNTYLYFCCLDCKKKKYKTRLKYIVFLLHCLPLFNDCKSELSILGLHGWNHRLEDANVSHHLKMAQSLPDRTSETAERRWTIKNICLHHYWPYFLQKKIKY